MHELRCNAKLHGIVVELGLIEIKCDSRFCGAGPGIAVLHRFDIATGDLVETKRFMNPRGRAARDGTGRNPAPVRPA